MTAKAKKESALMNLSKNAILLLGGLVNVFLVLFIPDYYFWFVVILILGLVICLVTAKAAAEQGRGPRPRSELLMQPTLLKKHKHFSNKIYHREIVVGQATTGVRKSFYVAGSYIVGYRENYNCRGLQAVEKR
jgi:hypothetical protein